MLLSYSIFHFLVYFTGLGFVFIKKVIEIFHLISLLNLKFSMFSYSFYRVIWLQYRNIPFQYDIIFCSNLSSLNDISEFVYKLDAYILYNIQIFDVFIIWEIFLQNVLRLVPVLSSLVLRFFESLD